MAHLERFGALAVFFHNHCKDTGLNPLEVLQTVPETARPGGYAGLLYSATNKLDIHHKRTSQLQVDGSDLHDKESALLSEFGREKEESDTEEIPGSVRYSKLTAVLVKAIQEQQALIETLQTKVAALEEA